MCNNVSCCRIELWDELGQINIYTKFQLGRVLWELLRSLLLQAEIALWNLLSPWEDEESPLLNKVAEAFFVSLQLSPGSSRPLSWGEAVSSPPAMTSMLHLISVTVLTRPRRLFHSPFNTLPNPQCLGLAEECLE